MVLVYKGFKIYNGLFLKNPKKVFFIHPNINKMH